MEKKSVAANSRKGKKAVPALPDASLRALEDPSLYINRELSLLAFQRRVLEEAEDSRNPLLERVKFLAILGSNLNEFFMVRVAGLVSQMDAGITDSGADGMPPRAQLIAIRREIKRLSADAYKCLAGLHAELDQAGIRILDYSGLSETQLRVAANYFTEAAFPVLTPLAFDPGRPFPHISNLSLNLATLIRDTQGNERFARIKVPDSLPPLVPVNRAATPKQKRRRSQSHLEFVWLEQVIAAHLGSLFPGMQVLESHPFHVTRDAEMAIKELEAEDLLESIEAGVRQRRFGSVVRLMVSEDMPPHILEILINNLEVEPSEIYRTKGPLSLSRLMHLYNIDRPDLKDAPFVPALPAALAQGGPEEDLFALIAHQDILLHHPFESFQPVIDFLKKAAHDPNVLAIKTCLYRTGRNSPIVQALLEAIEEEKQVATLVELKARFDEESNIEWARALEAEGVHVVYGLVGLKIHCKVAMVVRREGERIARYVHLSTGNYNAVTAHLYTDIGMFTASEEVADDVTHLFNYLTGYSAKADYQRLLVAPVNLRARMEAMIEREIEHQEKGRKGHLIFKTNALVDPEVIRLLYRASQAGVRIQLLVRGICSLRPGLAGISENIEVTSVVGRFLEHSRIYYFHNGGDEEVYLGSADLMERNLDHRVEILFPLADDKLIARVRDELLKGYLSDTANARRMLSDGSYVRKKAAPGKSAVNCQESWIPKRRVVEPHDSAETLGIKQRSDN
ncbi:MAG TPA: polyphosphate kinase 1 [Bryobacteraceae bacterium]|nr:polyphosphate kinase 1 [Bryobacteraceae bacterium]